MFLAEMNTEHFTFRALAATERLAENAILRGWKKHRQTHTNAIGLTLGGLKDYYGINIYPMDMNECCRDDTVLGVK